jgi:hypothetical protein
MTYFILFSFPINIFQELSAFDDSHNPAVAMMELKLRKLSTTFLQTTSSLPPEPLHLSFQLTHGEPSATYPAKMDSEIVTAGDS